MIHLRKENQFYKERYQENILFVNFYFAQAGVPLLPNSPFINKLLQIIFPFLPIFQKIRKHTFLYFIPSHSSL